LDCGDFFSENGIEVTTLCERVTFDLPSIMVNLLEWLDIEMCIWRCEYGDETEQHARSLVTFFLYLIDKVDD
jgi:hypothetical protein